MGRVNTFGVIIAFGLFRCPEHAKDKIFHSLVTLQDTLDPDVVVRVRQSVLSRGQGLAVLPVRTHQSFPQDRHDRPDRDDVGPGDQLFSGGWTGYHHSQS